jgi:YfiH family protein
LDNAGIKHGVFMRHGGCSPQPWSSLNLATSVGDSAEDVIENRDRISDALGLERNSFYDVWQVHSTKVVYAGQPRKIGRDHIKADAIITDQKNVALLMLFADCVPILLYDPERSIAACAHAGWKGTFNQIALKQ